VIFIDWKSQIADRAIFIWRRLLEQLFIKQFSKTFFTCLLVGWPMRNLASSIAIFHKIASSASLEATAAIITITARSALMFTFICIFRVDGAHDLLLLIVGNPGDSKLFFPCF
jgi:hypothetical protein